MMLTVGNHGDHDVFTTEFCSSKHHPQAQTPTAEKERLHPKRRCPGSDWRHTWNWWSHLDVHLRYTTHSWFIRWSAWNSKATSGNVGITIINHLSVITKNSWYIYTIPSHEWFMTLRHTHTILRYLIILSPEQEYSNDSNPSDNVLNENQNRNILMKTSVHFVPQHFDCFHRKSWYQGEPIKPGMDHGAMAPQQHWGH